MVINNASVNGSHIDRSEESDIVSHETALHKRTKKKLSSQDDPLKTGRKRKRKKKAVDSSAQLHTSYSPFSVRDDDDTAKKSKKLRKKKNEPSRDAFRSHDRISVAPRKKSKKTQKETNGLSAKSKESVDTGALYPSTKIPTYTHQAMSMPLPVKTSKSRKKKTTESTNELSESFASTKKSRKKKSKQPAEILKSSDNESVARTKKSKKVRTKRINESTDGLSVRDNESTGSTKKSRKKKAKQSTETIKSDNDDRVTPTKKPKKPQEKRIDESTDRLSVRDNESTGSKKKSRKTQASIENSKSDRDDLPTLIKKLKKLRKNNPEDATSEPSFYAHVVKRCGRHVAEELSSIPGFFAVAETSEQSEPKPVKSERSASAFYNAYKEFYERNPVPEPDTKPITRRKRIRSIYPKCNNELSDFYYSEDEKSVVNSADEENYQMSPERALENRLWSIRGDFKQDKEAGDTILLLKNMFEQIPYAPQNDEFDNPPMLPPKTTDEYMDALSAYVALSNLYGDIPSSTQNKRPNTLPKSSVSDDPRISLSANKVASDQKNYDKNESKIDIDRFDSRYIAQENHKPSEERLKGFRPIKFPYQMPLKANYLFMIAHTIEEYEYMKLINIILEEEGRYFAYQRARSKLAPHERSSYLWLEQNQGVYNLWNGERRMLTPEERKRFLRVAGLWIFGRASFDSKTKSLFLNEKGIEYIEYLKNPPPPPPPSCRPPARITARDEQECNVNLDVSIVNKYFAVEGRVDGMTRQRFTRLIEAYGGVFKPTVTKSTNYFVKGDTRVLNHTLQYHKAKEFGVPILTEEQFRALIKAQNGTQRQKDYGRRVDRVIKKIESTGTKLHSKKQ